MLKKRIGLSAFALLLMVGICGPCPAMATDAVELKARVMFIDLDNNTINVAEQEFALLYHYEKKKKVWDTQFLNKRGKAINPKRLKTRDMVHVQGEIQGEGATALEIKMLE